MEHWEARQDYYKSRGRQDDQAFEDMLGRRILKGLGCSEKQVYLLERLVFGADNGESPLWIRASKLFSELLGRRRNWGHLPLGWHLETLRTNKDKDKDAVERLQQFAGNTPELVLFTIPKNGTDRTGTVYAAWPKDTPLSLLAPPYRVVAVLEGTHQRVVAQEAAHFVAQFGPYEYGEELQ